MNKPSLVIVIIEDGRQRMLLYRYLRNCGLKTHEIRAELSPSGQGSAESWVRRQFAKGVSVYRNRKARAETALIVMTDADSHTVQDRFSQLDEALKERGLSMVTQHEQIARLVPKRNVETWILCLNGKTVDEQTDYKTTTNDWPALIVTSSKTLRQWTQTQIGLPHHCIDSLRTGVKELNRLAS